MAGSSGWRTIVRAVWNGPFHVGKLAPPISTGDALMKVLETLWRLIVMVVIVPAIGFAVIYAWYQWISPTIWPPTKTKVSIMVRNERSKIAPPAIETDKEEKCPEAYPLKVTIDNRSSETIEKTGFSIKATEQGHSNNLWDGEIFLETDSVIRPQFSYWQCYAAIVKDGYDASRLNYSGTIEWVEAANP